MILITGGLGFIGAHTARALLDLGESCVITRHRTSRLPAFLSEQDGEGQVAVEQLDCTDRAAFLRIGQRHEITGVVHLAAIGLGAPDPVEELQSNTLGLLNALHAAREWSVARVCVASTIGVYHGVSERRLHEALPLPMTAPFAIPVFKRAGEMFAALVAGSAGFEAVSVRIGAIWGPLGTPTSPFFALPGLVHAAVRAPASEDAAPVYADNGIDQCYVKDCGRAIALLQTANRLNHGTYNVSGGRVVTNAEVAAAIHTAVPAAAITLRPGRDPNGPQEDPHLDTARLVSDTGFRPAYDVTAGVADYVDWLHAGHER